MFVVIFNEWLSEMKRLNRDGANFTVIWGKITNNLDMVGFYFMGQSI